MNASVTLFERVLPSTVHLQVQVPAAHPSAPILGTERAGSGTLVERKGFIVTTNYIVLGAQQIDVTLFDGTTITGEVAAQDFASGVAVVKIDADGLPSAPARGSSTLERGHEIFVVAAAGATERRVSNGVVMALDAFDAYWEYSLDRAITTTAINPGLSGGAVFDMLGRMVGVVSLDLNEIGRFTLAIPLEHFLDNRDELLRDGRRTSRPPRAWVGLYCYTMHDRLVIAGVLPGTPADQAGIRAGDVLLTVDGQQVNARRALYDRLWSHRPGEPIECAVFRANEVIRITIRAGDAEEFFA